MGVFSFTLTVGHILAFVWVFIWSIPFTVRNKNDHYTYADRVVPWFSGIFIGFVAGLIVITF